MNRRHARRHSFWLRNAACIGRMVGEWATDSLGNSLSSG